MKRFGLSLLLVLGCDAPAPPVHAPGCLELPQGNGIPVAQVGDVPITADQIVARIRAQGTAAIRKYSDPAKMRKFVEDQVRMELLAKAAIERGLHRDPEVIDAARQVMVRRLLQSDMAGDTVSDEVTEGQLRAYYEDHKHDYIQPELRRWAGIQLQPTEAGRALARSLIEQLRNKPDDASLFGLLAARHSEDLGTKARGGESMFISREELQATHGPSFAASIFAMGGDELGVEPVQSTRGWHVVRLIAIREALERGYEETQAEIRDSMLRSQRSQLFDRYLSDLKVKHPVAIYEARLQHALDALVKPAQEAENAP